MEDCMSIPAGWLCYLSPEVGKKKMTLTNKNQTKVTKKPKQQTNKLISDSNPAHQCIHLAIKAMSGNFQLFWTCMISAAQCHSHQHFHCSGDPGAEGSPATVRGLAFHQVFTSNLNLPLTLTITTTMQGERHLCIWHGLVRASHWGVALERAAAWGNNLAGGISL